MQLKRDTDYALRILLCVAKENSQNGEGMTAIELSKSVSVPAAITARLCRKLAEAKLLRAADLVNGGVRYSLRQGALKKTVLDVICAVEDQKNLFAVFDRSTELYSICKDYFDEVDQQLMELLKAMTIFELLVKAKTAADNGS